MRRHFKIILKGIEEKTEMQSIRLDKKDVRLLPFLPCDSYVVPLFKNFPSLLLRLRSSSFSEVALARRPITAAALAPHKVRWFGGGSQELALTHTGAQ
jgi:hypothetical protein